MAINASQLQMLKQEKRRTTMYNPQNKDFSLMSDLIKAIKAVFTVTIPTLIYQIILIKKYNADNLLIDTQFSYILY